jgi:hypothetical protein
MPEKPILFFPQAKDASYTTGNPPPWSTKGPSPKTQDKKFKKTWEAIASQYSILSTELGDSVPEMVLVLELKNTVDNFYTSVRAAEELQFLGHEFDFTANFADVPPASEQEDEKVKDPLDTDRPTSSRIFLTLQNERSLRKIQVLWEDYVAGRNDVFKAERTSQFKDLFTLLTDVRLYSVEDRLRDTGFQDYLKELRHMQASPVLTEVELLFITKKHKPTPVPNPKQAGKFIHAYTSEEDDLERTRAVFHRFRTRVEQAGGEIIAGTHTLIPEIHYHAVAAKIPLDLLEDLTNDTEVQLLHAPEAMFFRPLGQTFWPAQPDDEEPGPEEPEGDIKLAIPTKAPIAALLDGLPLQNHVALAGRLDIDTDGVDEALYPAEFRSHGTAMASLITRGDLNDKTAQPLRHRLYVRPIMALEADFSNRFVEKIPPNRLPIDIVHKAVVRLFEGQGNEAPVGPKIKVINLSIGDPARPFNHSMSAWARLLDWLSWRYNVLFIVSAGNFAMDLELAVPVATFEKSSPEEIQQHFLHHLITSNFDRKVLAPSEAINAITVGAAQADAGPSIWVNPKQRFTLVADELLVSPMSRVGFGYRNSIKPDILMPGGRKCYRMHISQPKAATHTRLFLETAGAGIHAPGTLVAKPGAPGSLSSTGYQWGTSNAAALATRLACQIHEMLDDLNAVSSEEAQIPNDYFTVLIKALLVHGARWGKGSEHLHELVKQQPGVHASYVKKHVTPYIGYGVVDTQRALFCTDNRVILLGWGALVPESAHEYVFPLPASLENENIEKRLTTTLAWISPTKWQSRLYRQARMYVDNITSKDYTTEGEQLALARQGIDFNTTRRGTVQHDLLTGDRPEVYFKDGNLMLKVDCRSDAQGLTKKDTVRYGFAVTLEVPERTGVHIYEEIKQRLAIMPNIKTRA